MSASSVWTVSESAFPSNGSPRQRLAFASRYVRLAPTVMDWQPWELRLADTHLELIAKDDATLETLDPDGRELMIGCGAALHYLKQALKHFGSLGRVELFPDLAEPAQVARIHFGFGRERDAHEPLIFKAMTTGRPALSTFGERPVSATQFALLSQAVTGERGWLEFVQSETSRQRVMAITRAGDQRIRNVSRGSVPAPDAPGQTAHWTHPFLALTGRRHEAGNVIVPPEPPPLPCATLAVIKTKTDDKHGWLAAGQTMAQAVLQARVLGLSWGFVNQVRRRQTREALRVGIGHKGFAQIILRLGTLSSSEIYQPMATATTTTATFR